ncbi:MAG: YcxB family protein [Clostridia bacterium]|nr:YcxB family protein [Clostridia bacterium]NCC43301.1 YcxB family protein [Clostridia bacterium]
MKLRFEVKMTRQFMFDFLLQHTYRTLRGKLSLLVGLATIPLCVLTWGKVGRMFSVCYIFFAVFFLICMPMSLWFKAQKNIASAPVYRSPFTYKIDKSGITTIQNAQTSHAGWKQVEKVIESNLCLYVYISSVNAYVWPKAAIGKDYSKLVEMLMENVNNSKLKIRLPK